MPSNSNNYGFYSEHSGKLALEGTKRLERYIWAKVFQWIRMFFFSVFMLFPYTSFPNSFFPNYLESEVSAFLENPRHDDDILSRSISRYSQTMILSNNNWKLIFPSSFLENWYHFVDATLVSFACEIMWCADLIGSLCPAIWGLIHSIVLPSTVRRRNSTATKRLSGPESFP